MPTLRFAKITKDILWFLVKGYQYTLGPLLRPQCRYYPTCSNYALEALEKKSTKEAIKLIFRRLSSCHPLGGHGYDPLP